MRQLSAEHLAALALTAGLAVALVAIARARGAPLSAPLRRGLALLVAAGVVVEQLTYALRGTWSIRVNLPLHLSDAVSLVAVAALLAPATLVLVELLYFWALSGALLALLTPDLRHGFPDLLFLTFVATHGGAIVAACVLVLGERRWPRPGAARRAYALTIAFAGLAALGTLASGGNYLYLRRKPATASPLDVLGPWPWYLVASAAIGAVLFGLLAAAARTLRRRDPGPRVAGRRA